MRRILALFGGSLSQQVAYRSNFLGYLGIASFYFGLQLVFFSRVFAYTEELGGWRRNDVFLIFYTYVLLSLVVEGVAASVNRFFQTVHLGGIEPFLAKPVRVIELILFRWCQPAHFAVAFLVCVIPLATRSLRGLADAPAINVAGYVVGFSLAVLCNIAFITLLNVATFVTQRQIPVDYIHSEVSKLTLLPTSLFPKGILFSLLMVLPVALAASVPAAVAVRGDGSLLFYFGLATAILLAATTLALRWTLKRFDGLGG